MTDSTMDYTYAARLERLRDAKLRQTRDKQAALGFMDHDDHGRVLPPAGFAWKPQPTHANGGWYGARAWGRNFRSLMDAYPVYLDPDDALAGRWRAMLLSYLPVHWRPDRPYDDLHADQRRYGIVSGIGAVHHFAVDLALGLRLGWGGLRARIADARTALGPAEAEFLEAEDDVVCGIQGWISRTAAAADEQARDATDPRIAANLCELAALNARLVTEPPATFREACQWLAWFGMAARTYNGEGAGGQLDMLLWSYYARETAAGTLSDEEAIFDLACLLLNDTKYYQLGGPDAAGLDQTNALSFLILEAAHRLRLPCNLTIRVHEGLDEQLLFTGVRHLFEDRLGWPRFSGDAALVAGFMRNGYPPELARQRIAVGCHWMALPGREYTLNDCVKINVGMVFAAALDEMLRASDAAPSLDALWHGFTTHLERAVTCTARGLDFHLAHQWENNPELVLNLLCHGPLERGRDISQGGVEFYNLCVDGSALATVADSFAALEQRVVREGRLTWSAVGQHLRDNFAGTAGERVRGMLAGSERYGQGGDSLGDRWAERVSRVFTEQVKAGPTPAGYNMIPGWFSWSNTIPMGRQLGATPNGRRAGEPIAHGASPDPGFRSDGAPTAMARAVARVQPGYGNTAPCQLDLDPGITRDEGGVERVAALIRGHFDLGGTLVNINVLDHATLLAAHREPEKFPNLVVRVTGFTAFFSVLSPEFRQLVVDRFLAVPGRCA